MLRNHALAALLAAAVLMTGCATSPRHESLVRAEAAGTLAPVVPVRRFVANIDYAGGFVLSPDGRTLLWSQTVGTDAGLAVRPVAGGDARTFATGYLPRPTGPAYSWLPDSRHVAYAKDLRGDENTQLHVFDTQRPFDPWAVTPWPGVRSHYVADGLSGSATFYFASNRRDRAAMDLYEADAATRTVREVARSDGGVLQWLVGRDHRLAGRLRQLGPADGADVALEVQGPGGAWRQVRVIGGRDNLSIHRIDATAGKAWGLSNVGRDKMALVEIDLATGTETVLASHPEVDLSAVYYTRSSGEPVAWLADTGHPVVTWRDPVLGPAVEGAVARALNDKLLAEPPRMARPQSSSEDGHHLVVRVLSDFDDAELLLDRVSGKVVRLDAPEPDRRLLTAVQPFSFRASDGRTIHGYYLRPRGTSGPVPLVVRIHGGPWARDTWSTAGFNTDQLMANRGYAVLTVNYRGSWGYGRDYMNAGRHAYFTRMQQDIAEAAQWAVDQGLADPKRMAVLGASFGGFSVMAQLIHQQHDWQCGVNVVGVANWARVIENWPPFWRSRHVFHDFYGDPTDPAQRARMLENSPISHVDRIKAPMLVIHGSNDVRVLRQDSDEVVARLRELGRPVEYMRFDDEGHSIRRWRNRLAMWRRIEDTLSACLGGRSAGWDFYELMPRSGSTP